MKAGDKLYTGEGETLRMYTMGKAVAIASANLNTGNARLWKGVVTPQAGADIISLALADTAAKQHKDTTAFSYVLDKNVAEKAKTNKNAVVATLFNTTYQREAGKTAGKTYTTVGDADQTIKLANGWTANAGAGDDTLYGAVGLKAVDTINGGAGTNTIRLNTAADKVETGTGKDTIYGYAAGKDKIKFEGSFTRSVDKADVVLTSTEKDSTAVTTIKGMANGKAVKINGSDYYFGRNDSAKVANTFVYKEGAYYTGNEKNSTDAANALAKRDTLKVTTKAAENAVVIDMKKDASRYLYIDAVDASGMTMAKGKKAAECKGVEVTAGSTALRFIGSKFADTVTCGEGNDYIITSVNQGKDVKDVINNFNVGDIIQLNDLNKTKISELQKSANLAETLSGYGITVNTVAGTHLEYNNKKITCATNSVPAPAVKN